MLLRLVFHAFTDAPSMRQSIRRATKAGGLVLVIDFRPESNRVTTDMQASGFERVRLIDRWQDRPDLYALLFRKASYTYSGLGIRFQRDRYFVIYQSSKPSIYQCVRKYIPSPATKTPSHA
jgi:hypothetical protein